MAPPKNKKTASSSAPTRSGPVQILPYLYLGPQSTSASEIALAHGITHIISIGCSPSKAQGSKSISYHRLSLLDDPGADITTAVRLAAGIINNAKALADRPGKVLAHCVAGISRSPAVLAGYLIQEEGMSLKEALHILARAKPTVRPNDGFLRQLKEMEIGIRGSGTIETDTLPGTVKERLRFLGVDDAAT
ncbi:putative phosphatases II [Rosellinia necatrix]|uniref:protein-tyrosine-phosphatase n=1 Tax=Rosellinia necatrix TaxID=77044 RepID=A0A1S7UJU6_ROSNE|nr:putative phosphatases II [Rosellinia necatrix]